MNREEARSICSRALECVTADEATACLRESNEATTRLANSEITQNTAKSDTVFTVKVAFGDRVGSASVNAFDDESLRTAVERAEALAQVSGSDTEFVPCPGPMPTPAVDAYDAAVASAGPEERARLVNAAIAEADAAGVSLAGSLSTKAGAAALANTKGVFHYHPSTLTRFVCTAMTDSSSGWSEGVSHRLQDVNPAALAARSAKKALAGRDPIDVEPGDWTVVLEPAAVADMLVFLGFGLDAKAAIEGRSVFTDREGEPVAGDNISLHSDPAHPTCPMAPFQDDGMAANRVEWIKNGALNTLQYDRFWAEKQGRPYTGSPVNLLIPGGEASEEDLIRRVKRGLLITRFWYIRHVDPMKLLLTGMTRDGLFLIEDGRVSAGVKNLRFNESPLSMLSSVEALGRTKRCGAWVAAETPAMIVHDFTFTSGTSF